MRSDLAVPQEFETYSNALFKKHIIAEREFVELCLLALKLIDAHWDKRQGMAYQIAGAWINYKNIAEDDLLDQIGSEFGELELPDQHVTNSEQAVRQKWEDITVLVHEANTKFPAFN